MDRSDLITRLEQAEAGSFDLDMAVADAAKATDRSWSSWPYTTSLDAITALIGEKLPGEEWTVTVDEHRASAWVGKQRQWANTAPLALAAALLRAIKEGEHG